MRIVNYLKDTSTRGLILHCEDLSVKVSCDASFGMHADAKGHTGYIITLGNSYLNARSGKQKFTATSWTEAEIIAAVEASKMAIWIRETLRELRIIELSPIILQQDNKSSLTMVSDPSTFKRSKHMLCKIQYLQKVGNYIPDICPNIGNNLRHDD
jgi:hypothetical protein